MINRDVIGLLDCHNSPSLGGLTANRILASTSFLGRYAFADFALSNFCNSDIATVGILVKDHERSIMKHLGSMTSWVTNTKISHENMFFNEKGALNPAFNSDIANIRENDWILYDSNASFLVFESAHIVMNIDFRPILAEHIAKKSAITLVYKKIDDADKEFSSSNVFEIGPDGTLLSVHPNDGKTKQAAVSLECWIVNRTVLADIIKRHGQVDASYGMKEMISYLLKVAPFKIATYEFKGYARCFDSFEHYMDYSFELLNRDVANQLFVPEWPIYTITHDTPPALYGTNAFIVNSFVSNGCIVDGDIKDSILCRNVKVGKGSKVTHSIIFSNVALSDSVSVTNALIDKYSIVTSRHTVGGASENEILYVKQGAIL
jgi:glucose-1-phosphate adenylyltransferase